jgi:hypothetical protein
LVFSACVWKIEIWKRTYWWILMGFYSFCSQKCSKRNVRQAYHNVCTGEFRLLPSIFSYGCTGVSFDLCWSVLCLMIYAGCSKELGICAKCCTSVKQLVGRWSCYFTFIVIYILIPP